MIDVTITPDSVDAKTQSSDGTFNRVLILALAAFFAFKAVEMFPDLTYSLHHRALKDVIYLVAIWSLVLCIISGAAFSFVRGFFPSGSALHCDHKTLTVSKIPTLNFHGTWVKNSFAVNSIAALQFGEVGYSRYGSVMGITFLVSGQKQKVFRGLEAPEASQILDGLQKLGVDVVRDPGMPMSVEMALERRK